MKQVLIVLAVACTAPLHAEGKRPADPADPKAVVAPLRYESPFTDFRAAGDEKPAAWTQVNKEIEGAGMPGGHGSARAPEAAPAAPSKGAPGVSRPPAPAPSKPRH